MTFLDSAGHQFDATGHSAACAACASGVPTAQHLTAMDAFNAPPDPRIQEIPSRIPVGTSRLKNATVIRADGTRVDLGRPGTLRFRFRVARHNRAQQKRLSSA